MKNNLVASWQRFAISVLVFCGGFYLACWGPSAEARGLGGTMIGGVMAYWLLGARPGNGGGNGGNGRGTGEKGGGGWRNLTLRAVQVALIVFCGGLLGWWQLALQADLRYPVALGVGALLGCVPLAMEDKRVRGAR